jgi:hypothetical protein
MQDEKPAEAPYERYDQEGGGCGDDDWEGQSEMVSEKNPTCKKKGDRDQRPFHSEMRRGKRVERRVSSVRW